ncbi:nucleoside triphosphate pyrophosphohydrolase [Thiotrichales bacterium 19S3-7]|nr:nucleoside triphosphate pyrophosphohydrolase [Thiotrichales bacterium 19S3-7]MCF6801605.1 nucleoside triphosphate pyrophosphohydrolase [Thiotrichales bacterium 19S3-11]
MDKTNNSNDAITKLLEVMEIMRNSRRACHWTKNQTWQSLVRHTIEEAYEVADAVERGSAHDLKTELADLLNQVIFYAQIAKEQEEFDFYDVVNYLTDKLIRRHPNVFLDEKETDILELERQWEAIKKQERQLKYKNKQSILDEITQTMPALSVANKLQIRASQVGFDWDSKSHVFKQLHSEIGELAMALEGETNDRILDEIGDVMFCCVNLIRHLRADPEQVMRQANHKFEKRFRYIENTLHQSGQSIESASVEQMEILWQKAKEIE